MTFKSALQICLRIHLDCLVGPQDCLKRCRGGHQGELIHSLGIPVASTIVISGEPAVSILNSYGSILAPRKDDGTDFGCVWIQSNGIMAYFEMKGCCIREFF
jgi:hypothetical protein